MRRLLVIGILIAVSAPWGYSQSFYAVRRDRNLIISGGTGAARYFGDLVDDGKLGKVKPNLNFGAEYFFTARMSARAEVTWFRIAGADPIEKKRNLSFFSDNFELAGYAVVQLFPNEKKFYQRKTINPYIFAGYGTTWINPKTTYQGEVYALQPLQTEGVKYSRVQPVIPVGIGMKIKASPWADISIESNFRKTFTDYLDDVSNKFYPDPETLSSPLAVALSDRRREINPNYPTDQIREVRGNPEYGDAYATVTVKLNIYVPTSLGGGGGNKLYSTKRKAYKKSGGMFKTKKNRLKPHAPKKRR